MQVASSSRGTALVLQQFVRARWFYLFLIWPFYGNGIFIILFFLQDSCSNKLGELWNSVSELYVQPIKLFLRAESSQRRCLQPPPL